MNKKYCDRCGTEIHEPCALISNRLYYSKKRFIPSAFQDEVKWDRDYEICKDCEIEFKRWLENDNTTKL